MFSQKTHIRRPLWLKRMQNRSVGFSASHVNPGLHEEAVARWLRSGVAPSVSLTEEMLRELPRRRDEAPVLARFRRPRASEDTRLAVLSDIHLSTSESGSWKQYHLTVPRLLEAVRDIERRSVDGVIVAGDLTADGRPDDVARVDDLLSNLSSEVFTVPGNHDTASAADEHEQLSFSAGENTVLSDTYPYHARVGGIDMLCVDSTQADSGTKATLSADQLQWLDETSKQLTDPIVVSHHNLPGLELATGGQSWRSSFPMQNAQPLAEVLDGQAPLHVSGHLHLPAVAATGQVRELIAPALCSFPGGYLLLDIDSSGTTVRFIPMANIPSLKDGWRSAREYKQRSRMVTWMAHHQLTELPLVDEFTSVAGARPFVDGEAATGADD